MEFNENVRDVIDYFGAEKILDEMREMDIVDYVGNNRYLLCSIGNEVLFNCVDDDYALKNISDDDIIDHLEDKGYTVMPPDEENQLKALLNVCRRLKPKGYIDKEEAKKLLSDYIDTWMISAI